MLEEVLSYLHNWFLLAGGMHPGTYQIEDRRIALPFLKEGQYFRIVGSVFNDGLHQYTPEMQLEDETFEGSIWALGIPPKLVRLSKEISTWQEKYGEDSVGPYSSESFQGYSYTKATDAQTGGALTWQSVFRSRLSPYKKIKEF